MTVTMGMVSMSFDAMLGMIDGQPALTELLCCCIEKGNPKGGHLIPAANKNHQFHILALPCCGAFVLLAPWGLVFGKGGVLGVRTIIMRDGSPMSHPDGFSTGLR